MQFKMLMLNLFPNQFFQLALLTESNYWFLPENEIHSPNSKVSIIFTVVAISCKKNVEFKWCHFFDFSSNTLHFLFIKFSSNLKVSRAKIILDLFFIFKSIFSIFVVLFCSSSSYFRILHILMIRFFFQTIIEFHLFHISKVFNSSSIVSRQNVNSVIKHDSMTLSTLFTLRYLFQLKLFVSKLRDMPIKFYYAFSHFWSHCSEWR